MVLIHNALLARLMTAHKLKVESSMNESFLVLEGQTKFSMDVGNKLTLLDRRRNDGNDRVGPSVLESGKVDERCRCRDKL